MNRRSNGGFMSRFDQNENRINTYMQYIHTYIYIDKFVRWNESSKSRSMKSYTEYNIYNATIEQRSHVTKRLFHSKVRIQCATIATTTTAPNPGPGVHAVSSSAAPASAVLLSTPALWRELWPDTASSACSGAGSRR